MQNVQLALNPTTTFYSVILHVAFHMLHFDKSFNPDSKCLTFIPKWCLLCSRSFPLMNKNCKFDCIV